MDDLWSDYFTIYWPLELIICRICSYGVRIDHVATHLRKQHRFSIARARPLMLTLRRTITTADATPLEAPDELMPIPGLTIYPDGLQCTSCLYICRRRTDMEAHCRTKHVWKNPHGRGRPRRTPTFDRSHEPWRTVCCQRLYPAGELSSYFGVHDSNPADVSHASYETIWDQLERDCRADLPSRNPIVSDDDVYTLDRWLYRTGWATFLTPLNRDFLLHQLRLADDAYETWLVEIVRSLLEKSHQVAHTRASWMIRFAVLSNPSEPQGHRTPLRPFRTTQDRDRAAGFWQKVLLFLKRYHEANPMIDWPTIQLPPILLQLLRRLRTSYDEPRASVTPPDPTHQDIQLRTSETIILKLFERLLDQRIESHEYESVLIDILAVFGLTRTGWKSAASYAPLLSSVLRTSRL